MPTNLKYQQHIELIGDCPNTDCQEVQKVGFRFIKDQVTVNSFDPPKILVPHRSYKTTYEHCGLYGTSMYNSHEAAINAFNHLKRMSRLVCKTIGNTLASGEILPTMGVCSQDNHLGHFDFYEYTNSNIHTAFTIVGPLPC